METTKKMTASEKYNKFIDYNGLRRTVQDNNEIAYDTRDGNVILAWHNFGSGEYYHATVTQAALRADAQAFEKLIEYELGQASRHANVYHTAEFFFSDKDIESCVYLPYLVCSNAVKGTAFVDD